MRTLRRFALLAVMSSTLSVDAFSQELRLITLDRETRQPVANVHFTLLSRRREELDTARTGSDGWITLRAKEAGKFFISALRSGYPVEESDAIFLDQGETRVDTLYLSPGSKLQSVADVVDREVFRIFGVKASRLSARSLLLPEDIEPIRASARLASDLVLQKGPGWVKVIGAGSGRVCYQIDGGNCAAVFLNGQPVPPSTDIPAQEVAAIVILKRMDAEVAVGHNSGVVLLFTQSMLPAPR